MRMNIDSDSVVYDLNGIMLRRAERFFGRTFVPNSWNFLQAQGLTVEEVDRFWEAETRDHLYDFGAPIPGAIDALNRLADAGHDLRIVTHKHGMPKTAHLAMVDMIMWYRAQGVLPFVDIVITRGDKTSYPADVIVDDKPNLAWAQPGRVNILFDQPWNQILEDNPPAGVGPFDLYRAFGWTEVLEIIEQAGGGVLIDKGTDRSPVVI